MSRQLYEHHDVFGYRFIPGLKARVDHEGGGYLVKINADGFRCRHEFQSARPAGAFRVLLFGDSFTAGDGVRESDRYDAVLESLVPGLEVYNFGIPGTGTDQHLLVFREYAARYDHDMVIVGVFVENIRRVAARYRPIASADGRRLLLAKPWFRLEADGSLAVQGVPVPREPIDPERLPEDERAHVDTGGEHEGLRKVVKALGLKDAVQRLTSYQPLPAYGRPEGPEWRLLRAILERWAAESARPVMVVPIPLYQYVEETASPDDCRARFAELGSVENLRVHDPLDRLLALPRAERRALRFATDGHFTPAGHRVLAESIAEALRPLAAAAGGTVRP